MEGVRGAAVIAVVFALFGAGILFLATWSDGTRPDAAEAGGSQGVEPVPPIRSAERATSSRPRGAIAAAPRAPRSPDVAESPNGLDRTDEQHAFVARALSEERKPREDLAEEERQRRENAVVRETDGGLDILRRWVDNGADVSAVVVDFQTMRSRVRTGEGRTVRFESIGDVTPVKMAAIEEDAAVLEFGPGWFDLDTGGRPWDAIANVIRSLEIRGAGMDRTTIVSRGWAFLYVARELRNVSIHDVTLDFGGRTQSLEIRGAASIALENVRLLRWPGSGLAAAIGIGGGGFVACRGCEFVGGGYGYAICLRGACLASFDRCVFVDLNAAVMGNDAAGSRFDLVDCRFENARLTLGQPRQWGGIRTDIRVRGGAVMWGHAGLTDDARRAQWGAAAASSLENMTFSPEIVRCSVGDMIRALEAAQESGEIVYSIRAKEVSRAGVTRFDMVSHRADWGATVRSFHLVDGRAQDLSDPQRGGHSGTSVPETAGARPLLELLRRSDLPESEPAREVSLRVVSGRPDAGGAAASIPIVLIQDGQRSWNLDGRTGEITRRP